MITNRIGCKCDVVVEDISSSVKCTYQRCLIQDDFFCGGGSFETDVDLESQGIVNDLTSCIFLTAGLPVGSLDDLELCYTAEVTNGSRFTGCGAEITIPLGQFTNVGGDCECRICPDGVSVDIDCSNVNIGAFDFSVPGPRLEFCSFSDFVQNEALPTLFPALFPAPVAPEASSGKGMSRGKSMSSSGKSEMSRRKRRRGR